MAPVTLKSASHIHFTGIKGVGMTAVACCVDDLDIIVTGSDVPDNFVTAQTLKKRAFEISQGFNPEHIPQNTDLCIYTAAHGGDQNPQVKAAQNKNIPVISQAQAVGQLMTGKIGLAVCGVGGKSTVSAMLAHIFTKLNQNPSYVIGVGSIQGLGDPGKYSQGKHLIAEADEYATSAGSDHTPRFMHLNPQTIVCTNVAYDHPDVYASKEETVSAFSQFFQKLPKNGTLIINTDSLLARQLLQSNSFSTKVITYGTNNAADWQVTQSNQEAGKNHATIQTPDQTLNLKLTIPGEFNLQNALAALIVAHSHKLPVKEVIHTLQSFKGTKRRFEKVGEWRGNLLYDDYAHHPSEIKATLEAAKQWFPGHKLIAIFQPHTYSRTKAMFDQFTNSFTHADQVIITDIFASAREEADPSVSGEKLAAAINHQHNNARFLPLEHIMVSLKKQAPENYLILTLGAGDIYTIWQQIKNTA